MPRSGSALVVATYNLHGCKGADCRADPDRIRRVIAEIDPDVIALQEVASHAGIHGPVDQLDFLADALGLAPLAGPTLMRDGGRYGNAVLTRLPVLSHRLIDLSQRRREPRGAIDAVLDAGARRLRVIATHLGLRRRERQRQRQRLAAALQDDPGPLVVLGDMNEWWLLGRYAGRWWPGVSPVATPGTFPARWPLIALDHILVRPRPVGLRTQVHRSPLARAASDHLPLRCELTLDRAPPRGGP